MPDRLQPSVIARPAPTNVRWLIFVLACAASWLLYLHRYSWGIIKPAFREEFPDIGDVEIGWLDSAFLILYGAGQIPTGVLGDLIGPRIVLTVSVFVWSLTTVGVAWTSGFWNIFAARAGFGLAQAGAYPIISKITRVWFPLATRTTVQGVVTAMGRVGAAFAPLIIASLLMGLLDMSWQTSLLILTLPGFGLAVAVWICLRNRPAEHPWVNSTEREMIADTPPPALSQDQSAIREGEPPLRPVPTKVPFLQLGWASGLSLAMMFLYVFASTFQDQFYVNWLPSYLREGAGFDVTMMGLLTPLPLLGGAVGGVIGGILNDWLIARTGNRRWSRSGVAFAGKFLAACMVMLSLQFEAGWVTVAVLVAARVFNDWSLPTQWAAVTDMGGRAAATLFGIVNTIGAIGGVAAGPILGYLKREYDWPGIFYGVAAMCLAAALTWLFLDCTKRVVGD
ncbi:MAG: MFS transporter [Planctomycetes bacterium]|nr:MFS transporter [Planctomycetota bacterium]